MKTTKIKTKKGYIAVRIEDENASIVLVNDKYNVYLSPTSGNICEDQNGQEPFIEAYIDFKDKKEADRLAKIEAVRIAEEKRISDIKECALTCTDPYELTEKFRFDFIETARHWSDLYEERSGLAIIINSRRAFENFEVIKSTLNIQGEYVELCHRDGEHHSTSNHVYDLDTYQNNLRTHFNGDNYFYKSKDSEKELYLEKIKECEDIESIEKLLNEYNDIEAGYYDCNGNLEILEEKLEDDNITGYIDDVYSYSFGFKFNFKHSFTEPE